LRSYEDGPDGYGDANQERKPDGMILEADS